MFVWRLGTVPRRLIGLRALILIGLRALILIGSSLVGWCSAVVSTGSVVVSMLWLALVVCRITVVVK